MSVRQRQIKIEQNGGPSIGHYLTDLDVHTFVKLVRVKNTTQPNWLRDSYRTTNNIKIDQKFKKANIT